MIDCMGWLFGRKRRDPQDANEVLRRYNEAEATRLASISSGDLTRSNDGTSARMSVSSAAGRFLVEDVFTITGRGQVATGKVASGVFRVDDDVEIQREGLRRSTTRISGIEMFRRTANETTVGELCGLLLRDRVDVERGDVILHSPSG